MGFVKIPSGASESQPNPGSSLNVWDVVDGFQNRFTTEVLVKGENWSRFLGECYNTNMSAPRRDDEAASNFFHKVNDTTEIAFPVRFDAARCIHQESNIDLTLAH